VASDSNPSPASDDANKATDSSDAQASLGEGISAPANPNEPSAKDVVLSRAAKADAAPDVPRTRPPTWLIVLTIAIPLTVGTMWYSNWMGRPLSCIEIAAQLKGSNDSRMHHALFQVDEKLNELKNMPAENAALYFENHVAACLDPTLDFGRNSLIEPPQIGVHTLLLRTLGSMARVAQYAPGKVGEARSILEDTFIQTKARPSATGEFHLVQAQATCALAQHGDARPVILETLSLLLDDNDVRIRANAAAALGLVGNASTAPRLKQIASNTEEDPEVRQLAQWAYEQSSARLPESSE